MSNAAKLFALITVLGLSACQSGEESDQNVVITNEIPANADIEALPADESSVTSTEELQNGADEPDAGVNEGNSY